MRPSELGSGLINQKMTVTARTMAEQEAFNRLKGELTHAFAASEETYQSLTAAEVIVRNRA